MLGKHMEPGLCNGREETACPRQWGVSSHKYTYTALDKLTENNVFNIYGVVKFFKPPYRSKGTDFCSVVTIVDQTDVKLKCLLFSENQETLPKIYKIGDIVRFHRIKVQKFNSEIQGINSVGFSALVFDGIVGSSVTPRSTSKCYSFNQDDEKAVQVLRQWASDNLKDSAAQIKISDVKSVPYFDLLCQLIGKAEVDKSSYLLKVWDGTKSSAPSWKVFVENDALEGNRKCIHQLKNLTIDLLVYDNHVESAKSLKIGSYLVIHNVHAKLQTVNQENEAQSLCLEFHLHGGTCFGRGISVLPENNHDVQVLQKFLFSVNPNTNSVYSHPRVALKTHHKWQLSPISTIIKNKAPQKYCIRARIKCYEPENLYQSVKLYCIKCKSLHDVPKDDDLNIILQAISSHSSLPSTPNTSWYQSAVWKTHSERNRNVVIHFVKNNDMQQSAEDSLIMIEGGTLQEIYKLSRHFNSIIPVKSIQGSLEIDISIPFLIQGNRWHYGCKQCSMFKGVETLRDLCRDVSWNSTAISEALGINPLKYVFLMNITYDDGTGVLNAYLWNYSEQFFNISAADILLDDKLQEKFQSIMDELCPANKNICEHPWLECCIKSYNSTDGGKDRVCYEIFETEVFRE
ncbi:hypothetical protein GDO86_005860 [Hymenochirus boettgeri]|uniref:Protection of telomeres protein 1 n=1 Tax=Hymenochirus boettgeri TaxID=247094 RepID=A0A8T2J8U9_9PIPI|nr:hypothetical protein GDO86_005860 [Hymenochirus boettgeri]